MAKNYTSEEVNAAVTQLVRSSVRRPYGTLGNRDISTSFNDLQDAAAGVFLLRPNAPFYVVFLGTERTLEFLDEEDAALASLLEAITSLSRRVRPIENVSPLVNARVALASLEGAASTRARKFDDITSLPAYQRFVGNTDRFLRDSSSNVRSGGNIVQTPQEARVELEGLVRSVTELHIDMLRRLGLLAGALEDFEEMELGKTLAQNVLSNSRQVLDGRINELEALTPEERLGVVRDVTLDVLATRAAVAGFGSLRAPTAFVLLEGTGSVFTDEEHPGTGAVVQSDFLGPYTVLSPDDGLDFAVDDPAAALSHAVTNSFVARAEGTSPEPFAITAGSNDQLSVTVTGFPTLLVTFSADPAKSIEDVVAEFNAAVTTQPLVAEPYFNPVKFEGIVDLDASGSPSDIDLVFNPTTAGDWTALSIFEGDKILVTDTGSAHFGSLYQVDVGGISPSTLTCSLVSGTVGDESLQSVRVGPGNRFLRIRITDADREASVDNKWALTIDDIGEDLATSGAVTLGLFPRSEFRSSGTTADSVVTSINTSFALRTGSTARVSAEAEFVATSTDLKGRSDPNVPTRVVIYTWQGTVDYTVDGPGTGATFTVTGTDHGVFSEVEPGDYVILRSAPTGSVGAVGVVDSVSSNGLVATFGTPVTAATGATLECGPNLSVARDTLLRIGAGTANQGDYFALDPGSPPFQVTVRRPLPQFQNLGGLPFFFDVELGQFRVNFKSESVETDSALSVDGPLAAKFFTSVPKSNVGTTPYLLLPSDPKTIELGDMVEFYESSAMEPDSVHTIVGLQLSALLIVVDPPVPNDVINSGSFNFSNRAQKPFVRIRKKQKNNYEEFRDKSLEWLELPVNGVQYFRNLNRLINPLVRNTNPTASDVNSARTQVQALQSALIELRTILTSYQVDVVPEVDTLISSFQQRGADRASAILLEGQFSAFFGLSRDGVSYIGHALELLRDVQRLDLPVRKVRRKGVIDQEVTIATIEDPDAEFDLSDIQDTTEPDIPGQYTTPGGGNAF